MAADRFGIMVLFGLTVLELLMESVANPTTPVVYTFYATYASWYQGGQICLDQNRMFAKIPNWYISDVINRSGVITRPTWIGLHSPSDGLYTWTDCQPLLDHHPWDTPVQEEGQNCVLINNGTIDWSTDSCSSLRAVLCESDGDQCNFTMMENTIFDTTPDVESVEHATEAACRNSCLQYYSDCKECVGYSFTADKDCLMFTESDVFVELPVTNYNAVSGLKICHTVQVYQGNIKIREEVEQVSCDNGGSSRFDAISPTCTQKEVMIITSAVDVTLSDVTSKVTPSMSTTPVVTADWTSFAPSSLDTEKATEILESARSVEEVVATTDTPVLPTTMCSCPCPRLAATNNTALLEEIVKKLVVKKSDLSSFRRTKESVSDDRPSAQAVGKVGIAVLIAAGLLVLLFDADVVIKFVQKLISPRKYLSK